MTGPREPGAGEPSAYALLAAHARGAPDGRLAGYAAAGVLALGAGVAVGASWWWLLLLPVVSLGALGAWGIADRELAGGVGSVAAAGGRRRVLLLLRASAVVIGTAAAVGAAMVFLAAALGRMIS